MKIEALMKLWSRFFGSVPPEFPTLAGFFLLSGLKSLTFAVFISKTNVFRTSCGFDLLAVGDEEPPLEFPSSLRAEEAAFPPLFLPALMFLRRFSLINCD